MNKRKGKDFVRVTAYLPPETWEKMVSFVSYNSVKDGGVPTISTYGAISNTITDAIDNYCVIGYDYSLLKEEEEEDEDN